MARKLCCFFCPAKDYQPHELDDPCPTCGRPLGLPQLEPPGTIWGDKVVRALPRGFYSATYVVEQGQFRKPYVLKVCPDAVYQFFGKNFPRECQDHEEVARDSDHVVDILDFTPEPVQVDWLAPPRIASMAALTPSRRLAWSPLMAMFAHSNQSPRSSSSSTALDSPPVVICPQVIEGSNDYLCTGQQESDHRIESIPEAWVVPLVTFRHTRMA
jgi:hypothetical protein